MPDTLTIWFRQRAKMQTTSLKFMGQTKSLGTFELLLPCDPDDPEATDTIEVGYQKQLCIEANEGFESVKKSTGWR